MSEASGRKKILVISLSYLSRDPRVWRQIRQLAGSGYEVTAAGFDDPCIENVAFVQMKAAENKAGGAGSGKGSVKTMVFALPKGARAVVRFLVPKKARVKLWPAYRAVVKFLTHFFRSAARFLRKTRASLSSMRKIAFARIRMLFQSVARAEKTLASIQKLNREAPAMAGSAGRGERKTLGQRYRESIFAFQESDSLESKKVKGGLAALRGQAFDLVVANDFSSLSVAFEIRGDARLLYDAHEYTLGQYDTEEWKRDRLPYIKYILGKYLPRVDGMLTVSGGIADEYEKSCGIRPSVITNAGKYRDDLKPTEVLPGRIRIVHHGIAHSSRSIEEMMETVALLDERFTLDFYVVGKQDDYYWNLRKRADEIGRITFRDPVPMPELPDVLNGYDVGLFIHKPVSLNAFHVLPNKLFEFVQARLMVAIGPSHEMADVVRRYGLGVVAEDFSPEAMARMLSDLSAERIAGYKKNCDTHARELSEIPQMEKLGAIVREMLA